MPEYSAGGSPDGRARAIADALSSRQWDQLVDVVLARLERRVAEDAARRGRRTQQRVL